MKVLYLTLKKKWFDMILSGEKKEEYREIKLYWYRRFLRKYNIIRFKNGYKKKAPYFFIKLNEIYVGIGAKRWGAPKEKVYILSLGKILTSDNNM